MQTLNKNNVFSVGDGPKMKKSMLGQTLNKTNAFFSLGPSPTEKIPKTNFICILYTNVIKCA